LRVRVRYWQRMLICAIVLATGLAGYAGYPSWLVLAGAACLTLDGWWAKLRQLATRPGRVWSSKTATYFVTGVILDIALAALGFVAGRIARMVFG
jgi:hypothetical protein